MGRIGSGSVPPSAPSAPSAPALSGTSQAACAPGRKARTIQTRWPWIVWMWGPSTSKGAPWRPVTSASIEPPSSGSARAPAASAGIVVCIVRSPARLGATVSGQPLRVMLAVVSHVALRAHQVVGGNLVAAHLVVGASAAAERGQLAIGGARQISGQRGVVRAATHAGQHQLAPRAEAAAKLLQVRADIRKLTEVGKVHAAQAEGLQFVQAGVPVFQAEVGRRRGRAHEAVALQTHARCVTSEELGARGVVIGEVMDGVAGRVEGAQGALADAQRVAVV